MCEYVAGHGFPAGERRFDVEVAVDVVDAPTDDGTRVQAREERVRVHFV